MLNEKDRSALLALALAYNVPGATILDSHSARKITDAIEYYASSRGHTLAVDNTTGDWVIVDRGTREPIKNDLGTEIRS